MKKKLFAMALAFTLACSASGCFDSKPVEQKDTDAKTTQAAEENKEEKTEDADNEEDAEGEFDGEEYKMPDPVTGDVDISGLKMTVPEGWQCYPYDAFFSLNEVDAGEMSTKSMSGSPTFFTTEDMKVVEIDKDKALEMLKNTYEIDEETKKEVGDQMTVKKIGEGEIKIGDADAVYVDVLTNYNFEDFKSMFVSRQIISIGDNSYTFYISAGNKKELSELTDMFDEMAKTMTLPAKEELEKIDTSKIGLG